MLLLALHIPAPDIVPIPNHHLYPNLLHPILPFVVLELIRVTDLLVDGSVCAESLFDQYPSTPSQDSNQ